MGEDGNGRRGRDDGNFGRRKDECGARNRRRGWAEWRVPAYGRNPAMVRDTMNSLIPELVWADGDRPGAPPASADFGDDELLDSYSRVISAVVNRVAPTVVNIRVLSGERGPGGGSGF